MPHRNAIKKKRAPRKPRTSTGFALTSDSQQPRYEALVEALRVRIATGQLMPGDPVPSVRQLVRDLGVSHTTVTRGLRTLVEQGVLEARVGSGTRVAPRREKKAIGLLGLVKYPDLMKSAYMVRAVEQFQRLIIQSHRTVMYRHVSPEVKLHEEFDGLKMVDGVVLLGSVASDPAGHAREVAQMVATGTPMVALGAADVPGLACFDSDNENDSYRLINCLVSRGHRDLAVLYMDLESYKGPSSHRLRGVRRALAGQGIRMPRERFIAGSAQDQVRGLLALRPAPSAIFIASGIHRFPELYAGLKGSHIELGAKTLVAAYDESFWQQITPYGIRHIRLDQPLSRIVDHAFSALEAMIANPGRKAPSVNEASQIVEALESGDMRALNA